MERIRNLVKANCTSTIMMPLIQGLLTLPPSMARFLIANFTAPTVSQKKWIKYIVKPEWKGAWIGPDLSECNDDNVLHQRINEADLIIFKAHGGAFRVGHCTMYMDVFQTWISLLKETHNINALILSIDYSLSPEHMYPTAVLECVAAYQYLVNTLKVPGSKIVLSGDSAGGALCLEALIRVYAPEILKNLDAPRTNYDIELPAGLVLISPLVSSNTDAWLWQFKEDIVTPELARRVLKEYLNLPEANREELHALKLAQINHNFDRFAPKNVMVYVGGREVMRDDILTLANDVKRDSRFNVHVRQEDYQHDWYFIREIIKAEDKYILDDADAEFAAFAARSLIEATEESIDETIVAQTSDKNISDTIVKDLLVTSNNKKVAAESDTIHASSTTIASQV